MADASSLGDRLTKARKRRGLTQRELAGASGLSPSLIKKLEQGTYGDVRLETVHKLAVALGVPTTILAAGTRPEDPEHGEVEAWAPVRRALEGITGSEPAEEPTVEGVTTAVDDAVVAVRDSRYTDLQRTLPALLRDTDTLVAVSVNGAQTEARRLRSRSRQITGFMMGQTWQFTAASEAISLAAADATDDFTAMAAADWKCWTLIRQGRFGEAIRLASRWADDAEPRVSRATPDQLAAWGRFLIRVSTAAVRDNRPGEAQETLRLARMAAAGIGRDIIPRFNPWQVFGPLTVTMFHAQNALIQDRPDLALTVAQKMPDRGFPLRETWNRHRLDLARAHTSLKQYGEAVAILQDIRHAAPEWLVQQRYAQDILNRIIDRRRTLTPEMRELANFIRLRL